MKNYRCFPILGMHRSGTSMISGLLSKSIYVGDNDKYYPPQDEDNPKGYFENYDFRSINEDILSFHSYDVKKWNPNFERENHIYSNRTSFGKLKKGFKVKYMYDMYRLKSLISKYNSKYSKWGWKDPRTILILQEYKHVFDNLMINPCYILIVRNPFKVAHSLVKRGNVETISHGLALWYTYNNSMYNFITSNNEKYVMFTYEEIINKPQILEKRLEKVGINIVKGWQNKFIEPTLNRSKEQVVFKLENKIDSLYYNILNLKK